MNFAGKQLFGGVKFYIGFYIIIWILYNVEDDEAYWKIMLPCGTFSE
jgi:hypothetical protein